MAHRTPDATPTVDLGPGGDARDDETGSSFEQSAFDPPRERFETRNELGRGGMGRVDDAFDRGLGRPVAIKHMLSTAPVDLARFEREARITARLEHPGIVPIHDAGRNRDGTPYYVMRRVDGQPLDQRVTAKLAERLALIPNVLAACDAVAFAHARGVVHRDIKPTNILVGPFGETLVIDWGLARETDESEPASTAVPSTDRDLTRAGTVAGTPGFMAPEQARGEAVDARADVFALGATLYYVLAGQLPYGTISATEMIDLAGAGRSPEWRALPEDTPPELRAIAMKAMASEADDRYPDAGALAADLRRFITGNLVGAYEYSTLARLARFVRRHRAAVAVALVSTIVVVVGAVVSVRRVLAERDDANAARAIAEQRQRDTKSVNDRLLVQHALDLAVDDPIATISALRKLTPDSPRWSEARTAAAAAYVNGIPFGFRTYEDVDRVEIERGSRYAYVLSRVSGKLDVIDLIARSRRFVTSVGASPYSSSWLGSTHVVVALADHVAIADVTTGEVRTLPIVATAVIGDHGTAVWLHTPDRRLLELTDPTATPREIAHDVGDVAIGKDIHEAMVEHGSAIELWLGARHFVLEANREPPGTILVGAVRDGHAAILVANTIHFWHVAGDKVIDEGRVIGDATNPMLSIDIVDGRYYSHLANGLHEISPLAAPRMIERSRGINFHTPRGMVTVADNGFIQVLDERGWFAFGRRGANLRRADASADGRFVIVTTSSSSVLAWDLSNLYPKRLRTPVEKMFRRLTSKYLWLDSNTEGLSRIDLATGHEEVLLDHFIAAPTIVDPDDRFAIVRAIDHIAILDFTRDHPKQIRVVAECSNSTVNDTYLLQADGTLLRWQLGADAPVRIGSFDTHEKCTGVAAAGNRVIGLWPDHIEELDLATSRTRHYKVANLDRYLMQSNGRFWFHIANEAMWWWEANGMPLVATLPIVPDDMRIDFDDVLLFNHEALAMLHRGTWHIVSRASSSFSWAGNDRVAVLSTIGNIDVIDMSTELAFHMPVHDATNVATSGRHIAVSRGSEVSIWTIDVPDDPSELQRWLQASTNAEPIPNSDAYRWP